jgi:hypothetical protein
VLLPRRSGSHHACRQLIDQTTRAAPPRLTQKWAVAGPALTRIRALPGKAESATNRIHERLTEINTTVIAQAEAELGSTFLPVLRSQSEVLDEAVAERIGETSKGSIRRARDAAGWASGRQAADRARLTSGDLQGQSAIGA